MQLSEELLREYSWALRPKSLQGQFLLLHMAIALKAHRQSDLADVDHLNVGYGTLSRWLNGTAPLGAEPLKRMAEIFCKDVVGVSQNSLIKSDFLASYHFLEEASAMGEIHKARIPELASKFLQILEIPVEVGQPVPARSNLIKPHGKSAAAEPKHRGQKSGRSLRDESGSRAVAQTQNSQPLRPEFIAQSPDFVARPEKYEEIKSAILSTKGGHRNVALTTVLHGFGGFGKTTLAKEIYNDPAVRDAFPDGVFWVQCQQDLSLKPELLVDSLLRKLVPNWDRSSISDPTTAKVELVRAVGEKQILLVIDDVWYNAHAEVFRGLPPSCVVLMTTRMKCLASTGMSKILVDEMEPNEALDILSFDLQGDGREVHVSSSEFSDLGRLAELLGYWAQLLALANGRIRRSLETGKTLSDAIAIYIRLLNKRGIVVADSRDLTGSANEARSHAMRLCIEASLEMLDARELDHFKALGVFPKDTNIPSYVVCDYWLTFKNSNFDEGLELLEVFSEMSLLKLTRGQQEEVELHDNIIDYLARAMDANATSCAHRNMLTALEGHCDDGWETLSLSHKYGWLHLLNHMRNAGLADQVDDCLTKFSWLEAKLRVLGPQELFRSFIPSPNHEDAAIVGRAIAISLPAIARHPKSLARELFGRVGKEKSSCLKALASDALGQIHGLAIPIAPHLSPVGQETVRLVGHSEAVSTAEFSNDGQLILTASKDKTARIWDSTTGIELMRVSGDLGEVMSATFSQDDEKFLTSSSDGTVRIWSSSSGSELHRFSTQYSCEVESAVFSADEKYVLCVGEHGPLGLWSVETSNQPRWFEADEPWPGWPLFSKEISHMLTRFTRLENDELSTIWDETDIDEHENIRGPNSLFCTAIFSPNSSKVLTTTVSQKLKLWDLKNFSEIHIFDDGFDMIQSATFSKDGKFIVTGSTDNNVRVWDVKSGNEIDCFSGHYERISSVSFSPNQELVLSSSDDATARVWKIANEKSNNIKTDRTAKIRNLSLSHDGKTALVITTSGAVSLWDTGLALKVKNIGTEKESFNFASLSDDSKYLATASSLSGLTVWNLRNYAKVQSFQCDKMEFSTTFFSQDSRYLISASTENLIIVWDMLTGAETARYEEHAGMKLRVEFVEARHDVLSFGYGGVAYLWHIEDAAFFRLFEGLHSWTPVGRLSRDGKLVLTASFDTSVQVWEKSSGRLVVQFPKHQYAIMDADFSEDGKYVPTRPDGGPARLWSIETGLEICNFRGFGSYMNDAILAPDGKVAVTATTDGYIRIWNARSGRLVEEIAMDFPSTAMALAGNCLIASDVSGKLHFFLIRSECLSS